MYHHNKCMIFQNKTSALELKDYSDRKTDGKVERK